MAETRTEKMFRLLRILTKKDWKCKEHNGRWEEMVELSEQVVKAFNANDYDSFIGPAVKLNEIYKELSAQAEA